MNMKTRNETRTSLLNINVRASILLKLKKDIDTRNINLIHEIWKIIKKRLVKNKNIEIKKTIIIIQKTIKKSKLE